MKQLTFILQNLSLPLLVVAILFNTGFQHGLAKDYSQNLPHTHKKDLDACEKNFTGWKHCLPEMIKLISVKILNQSSPGSGVIIGDDGNSYLIATARHVINDIHPKETGSVEFSDGKKVDFNYRNIVFIEKDFALLSVKTENIYPASYIYDERLARIAYNKARDKFEGKGNPNFIDETREPLKFEIDFEMPTVKGTRILVAGYGLPTSSADAYFRLSPGNIVANISSSKSINGYNLSYTSPTIAGMSGGGVFAVAWCQVNPDSSYMIPIPILLAVHGQGEESLSEVGGKSGFNYSMKIDQFAFKQKSSLKEYFLTRKARFSLCPTPVSQWPVGGATSY